MTLIQSVKSRAAQQAGANTETQQATVTRVYSDSNNNITAADVRVAGQPYDLIQVANASGIRLWQGASVLVNWQRGSRFAPQIIGAAGSGTGTTIAAGGDATTVIGTDTQSFSDDLSGIPFLLYDTDESAPDGYVIQPGENVYFVDTPATGDSVSAYPNGTRLIGMRPLVSTSLPNPVTSGLRDGTLLDLVDSYGNPLGMYRLDKGAGVWRRRDVATSGGSGASTSGQPAFTTPIDSQFSWLNRGTGPNEATVTVESSGAIVLFGPATSGDNNPRLRVKNVLSSAYTLTMGFIPSYTTDTYLRGGFGIRDSATGKMVLTSYGSSGSGTIEVYRQHMFADYSSINDTASILAGVQYVFTSGIIWFRLQDDGTTNRIWSASNDGRTFFTLETQSRTLWATGDQVFFFVGPSRSKAAGMTLVSWKETSP